MEEFNNMSYDEKRILGWDFGVINITQMAFIQFLVIKDPDRYVNNQFV